MQNSQPRPQSTDHKASDIVVVVIIIIRIIRIIIITIILLLLLPPPPAIAICHAFLVSIYGAEYLINSWK